MEGKMVLMLGVTVMAFLSSLQLAACARDPQAGRLHLQGGGVIKTLASSGSFLQLACCNSCRPTAWDRGYVCFDRTELELGCKGGCNNCRCDPVRYPSCQCLDKLYSCPPPCDYIAVDAAAANMAEQLRA
ncbi:hypothetical protein Taro_055880 [Colocasia esculenta]|uniref:Bowman-Birk serine protease inhibitors family domain-containing protein n=1 Tax=Colocasia esculenta TaxID=4460 RepID=A0A843XUP4_COLES|nr:hypothetical protein [Colocasia esculenta]